MQADAAEVDLPGDQPAAAGGGSAASSSVSPVARRAECHGAHSSAPGTGCSLNIVFFFQRF